MGRRASLWPPPLRQQRYLVICGLVVAAVLLAWSESSHTHWEEPLSHEGQSEGMVLPRHGGAIVTFAEAKLNASLLDAGVCLRDYRYCPHVITREEAPSR